jgi:prophage tail gpP-like protein
MPSDPTSKPIDSNEVSVLIDRKEYRFWSELELHLSLDNHASVSFEVPFEPQYKSFRDTFTPFSFKPLEVHLGGNLVFTGNLIDVIPQAAPGERKAEITAYSKPGVLAKSDLPASAMPSEMRGLKLHQIAEQVCKPLGIDVIAQDYQGAVFKKVKCGHSTKVQAFLVDLAQQRGQVISSTNEGKLRALAIGRTWPPHREPRGGAARHHQCAADALAARVLLGDHRLRFGQARPPRLLLHAQEHPLRRRHRDGLHLLVG